jgi:nicotinamidase-related amidase
MTSSEPLILGPFPARFAPAHTALLIIDMQKDFCVDGFAASAAGRPIVELRAAARRAGVLVCHVGFWTLPDHLSDSGPWLAQRRRSTYASDRIAIAGTPGADFVPELSPIEGEVVIHKHRYSAFKGTDLDMVLRGRGIASVAVCGVSTNVCVESTLRDAFEHGYYVTAVGDACASWDTDLHRATLRNVEARFGVVSIVADLVRSWGEAPGQ